MQFEKHLIIERFIEACSVSVYGYVLGRNKYPFFKNVDGNDENDENEKNEILREAFLYSCLKLH